MQGGVAITVLLAVTNPTRNDFQSWAGAQLGAASEIELEEMISRAIGELIAGLIADRSDYVLFSTCTVDRPRHEEDRVLMWA